MLNELAAAVRERRVSPVELVEVALARIETFNPSINAVVTLRAEEALAQASSHRCQGALAGIPFLVKDLEHAIGMPTTFGSLLHKDDPEASEDGGVVQRLRAAGAIAIGKTNTPEFGWTGYTSNRLHGTTRNPWNLEKSPGGSSGGAGAALTAGMIPLATSSDGGGSVRIPAALSGLVGYKPTFGANGRYPDPTWMTFSMNGVLGNSVADVVYEAAIVLGPHKGDFYSLAHGSIPVEPSPPAKVIACPTLRNAVDSSVALAFDQACHNIDSLSFPMRHTETLFNLSEDIAQAWMIIAGAELVQRLEWAQGREEDMDQGLAMMLGLGRSIETSDYIRAQRLRFLACEELDVILGDDTVVVTPTLNAVAWPAEGPMATTIGGQASSSMAALNTMDLNFTGHPAVSVPIGLDATGVPIGLQIIAPRFRDDLALGLAFELERAFPWPRVAPGFDEFSLDGLGL